MARVVVRGERETCDENISINFPVSWFQPFRHLVRALLVLFVYRCTIHLCHLFPKYQVILSFSYSYRCAFSLLLFCANCLGKVEDVGLTGRFGYDTFVLRAPLRPEGTAVVLVVPEKFI